MSDELTKLKLKVYPSAGNFILVEFPASGKTAAAANDFLLSKNIIVRDVVGYGLPKCLRISIGKDDENRAVVSAIAEFLGA